MSSAVDKRRSRNSYRVKVNNRGNRPILTVYKSNKNIYAQIIDLDGKVLASFSSKTKGDKPSDKTGIEVAQMVGDGIAKEAKEAKISKVVFNKGPYLYIGRVKALADAARQGGLEF